MPIAEAYIPYDRIRKSMWSCLYGFSDVLPGLLAMFFIAIFSNNLPGVPNPFTLENLFTWVDNVVGPINGQPLFQILNSNFVWNPLLAGLIIGNVFGVHDSWKRGLSYIHKLMPLGIILLGPHFMVGHALKAGAWTIVVAAALLLATAGLTLFLARFFKADDRYASVLAGGLCSGDPHVCAILMPMIKAKGGQVANAAATVVLFGALASFALPLLNGLIQLPDKYFGLASVLGVGNGAQALNAAFGLSYEAGRFAKYYDSVRHVVMPLGFIGVFIIMFVRKLRRPDDSSVMATRGVESFPVYLGVFIAGWLLACLHVFREPAHHVIFGLVKWDFSLAAGALGLSLPLREVWQWGLRGFALVCTVGVIRIAVLFAALFGLSKIGFLN